MFDIFKKTLGASKVDNDCEIKVIASDKEKKLYEIYKKHVCPPDYLFFYWKRVKVQIGKFKQDIFTRSEVIEFLDEYRKNKYEFIYKDYFFKQFYIARNKENNEEYYFFPAKKPDED